MTEELEWRGKDEEGNTTKLMIKGKEGQIQQRERQMWNNPEALSFKKK